MKEANYSLFYNDKQSDFYVRESLAIRHFNQTKDHKPIFDFWIEKKKEFMKAVELRESL